MVVIPLDPDQPEAEHEAEAQEQQKPGPSGPVERMVSDELVSSPVTSLPRTPGDSEESPRSREGRVVAVTLEQEMGRRSVAEAMRLIRDWAVASSSSAGAPVTKQKHPASPPEWPPRRKTASTPRPEKGGAPTRPEQGPGHSAWSPVVRTERPSALRA